MKALAIVMGMAAAVSAEPPKASDDLTTARLAELRTGARCAEAASPWRPWCIAADYAKGTAPALPKGKVLIGMTLELETGKDVATELSERVTFVAFAVSADGKVKLTDVKPTDKDEEKAVAEAIFNTSAVFKNKAKLATVPAALGTYIKTLTGTYPATKAGSEWTFTGASAAKLRKVGAFWVAIETPAAANGIFATILTDAWAPAPATGDK